MNIDGLDHVFHLLDFLLDVISGDLSVDDGGSDNELLDSVGDGGSLELSLPEETVLDDFGEDSLTESLEIGLVIDGLDLVDDEGLSLKGCLTCSLGSGLLLGLEGLTSQRSSECPSRSTSRCSETLAPAKPP